ncbi:beta-ketoacyl-[acyl-carrier-protein] synthase II [Candidatus Marinamargulisbacteria bacterium SCGC AG-414-C22]|nr:beta-ketoacyl-[acyl-carrier-protein] synthase II [Candidatus Marinamargulisbacteria bacterium SCGC AG-414-C22]
MSEKIVITGVGLLTPLGLTTEVSWNNLIKGHSGIKHITRFDTSKYRCKIGAELPINNPFQDYNKDQRIDRIGQYALCAAEQAINDAGLSINDDFNRTGVILGSGLGGIFFAESQLTNLYQRGPLGVHPLTVPQVNPNAISTLIAKKWKCLGPNMTISTACASSAHAIGQALDQLKLNRADRIIVGGAETPIMPMTFAGFNSLRVMSTNNKHPEEASRPFDKQRDGFVMGEGAGVLILEKESLAKKRKASIYAELAGYGATNGGFHPVAPLESGDDAALAINIALKDAGLEKTDIDYINAHGTSTVANDIAETNAIKQTFNGYSKKLHISSTKSQTGHLVGAAGAIEAIFTAMAIYHEVEPATMNYTTTDIKCNLDYIPNNPRERNIKAALSNSFGFGNNNAVLAFKKV